MYIKRNSQRITIDNEVDFDVSYYYYPAEDPIVRYPDGSGYPGSPATVEIHAIFFEGIDVKDVINLNDTLWEQFIEEILNYETDV